MVIVKKIPLASFPLVLFLLAVLLPSCTITSEQVQSSITEQTAFLVGNLYTEPLSPQPDETFTLSITVTNSGDKKANYNAALDIIELEGRNEIKLVSLVKSIMVAAGDKEIVTFDDICLQEGEYNIVIDNIVSVLKVQCT